MSFYGSFAICWDVKLNLTPCDYDLEVTPFMPYLNIFRLYTHWHILYMSIIKSRKNMWGKVKQVFHITTFWHCSAVGFRAGVMATISINTVRLGRAGGQWGSSVLPVTGGFFFFFQWQDKHFFFGGQFLMCLGTCCFFKICWNMLFWLMKLKDQFWAQKRNVSLSWLKH